MPTSIAYPPTDDAACDTDGADKAPCKPYAPSLQSNTKPVASRHWTQRPESGRHCLSKAVDRAEDGGMGRAVVEQDNRGRKCKRPRRDLEKDDTTDAGPDEEARGRIGRWIGRGEERDHRGEEIGGREKEQARAETPHQSIARVDLGVEQELQQHANHTNARHGKSDGLGWKCKTANRRILGTARLEVGSPQTERPFDDCIRAAFHESAGEMVVGVIECSGFKG